MFLQFLRRILRNRDSNGNPFLVAEVPEAAKKDCSG